MMRTSTIARRRTADAPPLGRRERKKQDRKAELLRLARESFAALGYDATSMESIAAAADVAVGTVYNYFPTKSDLLFNILFEDIQPILSAGFAPSPERDDNPLLELIRQCFVWFDRYDRALIRRFTADALLAPPDRNAGYFLLEQLLAKRTLAIVQQLRASGAIKPDVDPETYARLVFNLGNAEFYNYLVDEGADAVTVSKQIAAQLDLVWRGIRC